MDPLLDPEMAEWLRQKKEALAGAYDADKQGQADADRKALLMQFAQGYANQRPTPVQPRQVNDARSRFAGEYGLEKDARSQSLDAVKTYASMQPKPGEAPDVLEPDLVERAKKVAVPTEKRKREAVIADILAAEKAGADRSEMSRREREKATGDTLKTGGDLRKEYLGNPQVRRTQEMAEANEKIQGTSETGPGDISLLVAYMKMVDPGSTVRENEFATAENAGGVPSKVRNIYNKVKEGDKLPPEMRAQFRAESRGMLDAQFRQHERLAEAYRRLAKQAGLSPEDVVLDLGFSAAKPPAPAGGGTVTVLWKGKRKKIPAERLEEALAAGAQKVE